jgi:hypothetical protein
VCRHQEGTTVDYSTRAADRRALTLDELHEFVESLRAAGVPGRSPMRAGVAIEINPDGQRLTRLTCETLPAGPRVTCEFPGCGDSLPDAAIVEHLVVVHGIHLQSIADAAVRDVTGEDPHPEAST